MTEKTIYDIVHMEQKAAKEVVFYVSAEQNIWIRII